MKTEMLEEVERLASKAKFLRYRLFGLPEAFGESER
jgi:hypothetical protein